MPAASGTAKLAFAGAAATLWLDRPEQRNAIDAATWRSITGLIAAAAQRRETRVIVVRGAGGNFAAGADIGEFDTVFADRGSTLAYLADMSAATEAIEAAPLPVIALIEGLCIGAGVAVALACDLRIAADSARFAITPAKLGLMFSLADTKRVVAAIGPSAAKDLLFTGRTIDAVAALAIGLVDEVHPADALATAVDAKAESIAAMSAWTHARTKAVVHRIAGGAAGEDEETRGWFADAPAGPDYREGLAAFRGRRRPAFPSR